jgi:cell division protein FtsW (lipid II flippase)
MSTHIDEYINDVCLYIKCRKAHKEVTEELCDHINEVKERLISDGITEETAELQAIEAMGESRLVGEELNKKYKPQTSWSLLAVFGFIIIFSGVFSYLFANDADNFRTYVDFRKYLVWVGISLTVMIFIMFLDYTKLNKYAVYLIVGIMTMMFLMAITDGSSYIRFMSFGITFNIAEIATLLVIPLAALLYRARNKGFLRIIGFYLLLMAFAFLFGTMRNMTNIIIVGLCAITIFTTAVIKKHFKISRKVYIILYAIIFLISFAFIWYYLSHHPHLFSRFEAFFTRGKSAPLGEGWQRIQADYWLGKAKIFGAADSVEQILLPDLRYTFILVNIIAHLGWAAGIAIVAAIAFFIIQLFRITGRIKNDLGFYISLSASIMLAIKFVVGVLMNFGLIPIMDCYIPFLSYQGSGYITDMILLGTVLSVWRYNKIYSRSPEIKAGIMSGMLSYGLNRMGRFLVSLNKGDD